MATWPSSAYRRKGPPQRQARGGIEDNHTGIPRWPGRSCICSSTALEAMRQDRRPGSGDRGAPGSEAKRRGGDHPRCRTCHRNGDGGAGSAGEHLPTWTGFAAWLGLTPRQHSSGGKERLGRTSKMGERSLRRLLILGGRAPPPGWRRATARASVARSHAGQEAADAGDRGAGEQDGEDRLGADGVRRVLQSSGHGGIGCRRSEAVEEVGRSTGGMAQRSTRRVRKTRIMATRLERAKLELDPVRELHTGQQHVKGRIRGRTHVST